MYCLLFYPFFSGQIYLLSELKAGKQYKIDVISLLGFFNSAIYINMKLAHFEKRIILEYVCSAYSFLCTNLLVFIQTCVSLLEN